MQKQKLKLEELNVDSFVTSIDSLLGTIRGGSWTDNDGTTCNPNNTRCGNSDCRGLTADAFEDPETSGGATQVACPTQVACGTQGCGFSELASCSCAYQDICG
jgi:hypothetical protein